MFGGSAVAGGDVVAARDGFAVVVVLAVALAFVAFAFVAFVVFAAVAVAALVAAPVLAAIDASARAEPADSAGVITMAALNPTRVTVTRDLCDGTAVA
jgi:glycerol-3-phosphate acyltransferase PlsY